MNLLKFTAPVVAQLRTSPAQVVGCNMVQACSLTAIPDHIPHNVLRDATTPHFSLPCHRSEDFALTNRSGLCPLIESGFHPIRNGHRANVATLADQIDHSPVTLAHLDFIQLQPHEFRSPKTAAKQHGQHRVVAFGTHGLTSSRSE